MRLFLLALSLLIGACAGGQRPAEGEPRGPPIRDVRIAGAKAVHPGSLLDRIATRGPSGLPFFRSHPRLDPAVLPIDEKRIRDLHEEAGYYAARVRSEVVPLEDGRVDVIFHVEQGPPTIVRSLVVAGLEDLTPEDRAFVLQDAPLVQGDRLVEERYVEIKLQIQRRLEQRGHARAEIDGLVEIAPGAASADVLLSARPGTRYRFGDIVVTGNQLVAERKIRDAAAVALRRGKLFSPEAMEEAQGEVLALGPFSMVTVTQGDPVEGSDVLPARASVRESNFLRVRFGAGVGVETNRQQARILADFAHLNLWGDLQKLELETELSYRFIPSVLNAVTSGPAGTARLSLTQPDLITTRVDLATRLLYERQLQQAFSSQRVGGRLATPVRFRRWLVFVPSYNIDYYFDVSGRADITLVGGQRAPQLLNCEPPCVLSYLEQVLAADRRDVPFEPTHGWYAALGLQEGGGPLQGAFDWVRVVPEVRGYLPVARELILAGRLELGYLQPLTATGCEGPLSGPYANCSPILVRFFGGGAADFRGYGADQLGPLLLVEDGDEGELVPLGGNSHLLASSELRWRVADEWTTAFFLEVANVAATPTGAFVPADLSVAVGGGARYRTPVGPARLDVGFRPFSRQRIAVTPTGEEVAVEQDFFDRFAVFLSLGEAF